MNIFIDGFQNTGKSTLIDNCNFKHNRFPFNQYMDEFSLDINTYQIGKDLGILFGLQYNEEPVIFDRGPFSTIFYSLKENRYGNKTIEIVFKFLKEIATFKNCRFVWIKKINNKESIIREHNDGFDYLDDENDLEKDKLLDQIIQMAESVGIKLYIFENDFSISLKENYHRFNNLLGELINEYNRN